MLIKDIMSSPAITISPSATVGEAARLMLDRGISGLPVVDTNGRLRGIVTEGDFLRRTELDTEIKRPRWLEYLQNTGKVAEEYVRSHGRTVEDVMQAEPVTCAPEDALRDAVEAMLRRHIKRLPVVANGVVVGVVSRSDLLRALAPLVMLPDSSILSDAQIEARIETELRNQTWAGSLIEASVKDGVATIQGTVFDERQQQAVHVLVENVAGVKSVVDHLLWIEPTSATVLGPADFSAR
jgi:CBS domain-containing protein